MIDMLDVHKKLLEDFQIHKVLREYGGCKQCGWCCHNERLTIFKDDVIKLGSLLKQEHIQKRDEISITLKLPCPFTDKNRCRIYNRRSDICKTYPFLLHYLGMFSLSIDCPLGKKIGNDIINYCKINGIKILGDDEKTEAMKMVDQLVKDRELDSGDGYSSNIMNIPFDLFREFLNWREKNIKRQKR